MKRLITCMAVFIAGPWMASGDKVTLCHFGETKQVNPNAVEGHLSHGDYLGPCAAPEPTPTDEPVPIPTPAPTSTPEPSKIVIENMWLITGWRVGGGKGKVAYCILISDTHPSYEQQVAKCFPPFGWYPLGAPCAGPVYSNDVWACDGKLQEQGWSRLSLADLCQRYPKWCGQ